MVTTLVGTRNVDWISDGKRLEEIRMQSGASREPKVKFPEYVNWCSLLDAKYSTVSLVGSLTGCNLEQNRSSDLLS